MPKPFYSRTQADLATGQANLIAIVTPVPATWGLTAAEITSYTTLSDSYSALLATATTPGTRTSVAIEAKNNSPETSQSRLGEHGPHHHRRPDGE